MDRHGRKRSIQAGGCESTQVLADSSAWCPCSITITNGTCGQPTHTELIDLGYGLWTPKCWNSTVTISGDSKSGYSATWQ
ncbi:MAG: hypothetical protein M0009_05780 [Deltaproteobacteria bacterium]|nr:hypothetical protein [Deltaproteobacteria bacterium]